jgi:hypothetical protein
MHGNRVWKKIRISMRCATSTLFTLEDRHDYKNSMSIIITLTYRNYSARNNPAHGVNTIAKLSANEWVVSRVRRWCVQIDTAATAPDCYTRLLVNLHKYVSGVTCKMFDDICNNVFLTHCRTNNARMGEQCTRLDSPTTHCPLYPPHMRYSVHTQKIHFQYGYSAQKYILYAISTPIFHT